MAGKRSSNSLSEVRERILQYIISYRNERGYSPSMREIGDAVDLSAASSVKYQLSELEKAGYIALDGLAR